MTTPETPLDEDARDRAAAYAFDLSSPEEARAFADEAAVDARLAREVGALRAAADAVAAEGLREATPSPALRARLMAQIAKSPPDRSSAAARQPWKAWTPTAAADGFRFVAGDDGGFEPTAYPGISAKPLFTDRAAGRATMLVRMAPGASYPAHRHGGFEECFVLEGTLRVGDALRMRKGDYQAAVGGSTHDVQATDDGCLLLIASSLADEFV